MAKSWNPSYLGSQVQNFIKWTITASSWTAAAGTINADCFIGSLSLSGNTLTAWAEMTITLTNNTIGVDSVPFVSVGWGTGGTVGMGWVTVTANQLVITITNLHASIALDGTVKVYVEVINPRGT